MKFKMTMVATVVALTATNLYAQETYNVEVLGSINTLNLDNQEKWTNTKISGNYYLKPIKIDNAQPYGELDFLQKASSLTLSYGNQTYESENTASGKFTPLAIAGNFYFDNFILGLSNSNRSTDLTVKTNAANYLTTKNNLNGINIGYFITTDTAVYYKYSKDAYTFTPSAIATATKDLSYTTSSITSQTVTSMGVGQTLRVDLQYNQITREQTLLQKNNEYGVSLRYYPESKYYVEGGYLTNTGDWDYTKGNSLSAGIGYSLTSRFNFALSTAKFTADVTTQRTSSTSTTLTAGYRF